MKGDWVCGACQHLNFGRRINCERCDETFVSLSRVFPHPPKPLVRKFRPGDWYCDTGFCQAHNYGSRLFCYQCHAVRRLVSYGGSVGYFNPAFPRVNDLPHAPKLRVRNFRPGDWFCDAGFCWAHNDGSHLVCYKCRALRHIITFGGRLGYFDPVFPIVIFWRLRQMVSRISRRGWRIGDWFCTRPECCAHNYRWRVKCFKCNSLKEVLRNTAT